MLEAHIFRTCQKDLRNLALQERRLRNQLKEDTAQLLRLQEERRAATAAEAEPAKPAPTQPNGFEFSTPLVTTPPAPEQPTQPAPTYLKSEATAA
jgi:hypothetical protein